MITIMNMIMMVADVTVAKADAAKREVAVKMESAARMASVAKKADAPRKSDLHHLCVFLISCLTFINFVTLFLT